MTRKMLYVLILVLLAGLTAWLVSSPVALAEWPAYAPVTLDHAEVEPLPMDQKPPYAGAESAYLENGSGYLDPTLSVRIEKMHEYDTDIYITWVQIADPTQLRTELNKPYPSKTVAYAEQIARRVKAVLAINGDYFIDRKEGWIVRNGKVLRTYYYKGFDALLIDREGNFHIVREPDEEKLSAYDGQILHAFSFGPGLIIDGVRQSEFTAKTMSPAKRTQRMVLCQMEPLSYMILTAEGPEQKNSEGLTLEMTADILERMGVQQAYNLDGGSSTWLVLNGHKVNAPSKKRGIADIVYFVTAQPEEAQ